MREAVDTEAQATMINTVVDRTVRLREDGKTGDKG